MSNRFTQLSRPVSRRAFVRGSTTVVAAGLMLPAFVACGNEASSGDASGKSKLDVLREKGVARLGMSPVAPYCYVEDGKPTGFVNDEAILMLNALGIDKVEPVVVDFAAMVPSLIANRFDVCTGALYITTERCQQVLFANPDTAAFETLVVPEGNPNGVEDYESIAADDLTIGCIAGTQEIQFANDAGVRNVSEFPDSLSALEALQAGRVDVVGYDSATIGFQLLTPNFADLEALPPFTVPANAAPTFSGMAFNSSSGDLRDAINRELKKLQDSGKLEELAEKYGIDPASVTACYGVETASLDCANS